MPTATTQDATDHVSATVETGGSSVTGRFPLKNLPTFDVTEAAKPLYAVVGAADLALEQVKDVPVELVAQVGKVQARLAEVPAQVQALRPAVETRLERANQVASDLYAQLSVRGERLVTSIRRQPATEAAIVEGKEAVRKAEAAAVAAKNSVHAGEKALEGAVDKIG